MKALSNFQCSTEGSSSLEGFQNHWEVITSTQIMNLPVRFECKGRIINKHVWNRKRVMAGVSVCRFSSVQNAQIIILSFNIFSDVGRLESCLILPQRGE